MEYESHSIRLLHVEDNDGDAKLITLTLKKIALQTFEIQRVTTMGEALNHLDSNSVDVVLLDLSLPDSNGLDSVRRLRTFSPRQAIIVITGTNDESVALQAVQHGAQDYLVKDDLTTSIVSRAIRYSLERHKYDRKVARLANYDSLTGLPNRTRFHDHISYALQNSARSQNTVSLLFIDCDKFKLINDTLGHQAGDEFLKRFAKKIKETLRTSDFVARLAGDEFVIVLENQQNSLRSPLAVAEKILHDLREGLVLDSGARVQTLCSIGIASSSPEHPVDNEEQLLKEADAAMYSAKEKGGDCACFYDIVLERQAERRLTLLRGIMNAYRNEEFSIHYQPILNSFNGKFEGLEALLRWKDKSGNNISPVEFIPLLEETGIIKSVGNWVLHQSCQDFMSLKDQGYLDDKCWVSINVSAIQFNEKDFLKKVQSVLIDTQISPSNVHIEITESLLLDQTENAIRRLVDLRNLGLHLSIDDFGTGYSSMAYLKDLPVNSLKIDKSFILQCLENSADSAITKAMIALAHNLNMTVIAEGVESKNIYSFLSSFQCDFMQGFLYSKALPIQSLRKFYQDKLQHPAQKQNSSKKHSF